MVGPSDALYPTVPGMGLRGWLLFVAILAVAIVVLIGIGLLLDVVQPGLLGHLLSPFNCGTCTMPVGTR